MTKNSLNFLVFIILSLYYSFSTLLIFLVSDDVVTFKGRWVELDFLHVINLRRHENFGIPKAFASWIATRRMEMTIYWKIDLISLIESENIVFLHVLKFNSHLLRDLSREIVWFFCLFWFFFDSLLWIARRFCRPSSSIQHNFHVAFSKFIFNDVSKFL